MKIKTNVDFTKTVCKLKDLQPGSYFKFKSNNYNTWDAFLKTSETIFVHAPNKRPVSAVQIGLKDYANADVMPV